MSIYNDIMDKIDELFEKINSYDLSWLDDVSKTFHFFARGKKLSDFQTAIECVSEELEYRIQMEKDGDSKKKRDLEEKLGKIKGLIEEIRKKEPDFLIEKLKKAGYAIASNNKALKDAIEKEALRILEQTRLGKRDNVMHMLIRNFVIRQEKIPDELIDALKPQYDTNLFKAFIYAFLSGFISKGKEEENE